MLGLERAHELHPYRTILLHNVDDALFWTGVLDRPYRLFGARVFLTPGTERRIAPNPDFGDPREFVLPAEVTAKALDSGAVVVYDASGHRLRNITSVYAATFEYQGGETPRRIDASSSLMDYLFGPTWYPADPWSRWMPEKGTVRIGGPTAPSQKLVLRGICAPENIARGPVELRVTAAGVPLEPVRIASSDSFELAFPLPEAAVGKDSLEIGIEVSRTYTPPGDGRRLGLALGVIEIR